MKSVATLDQKDDVAVANVLIVDDDEAFRECMADLLCLAGYHCEVACDGAGALERVQQGGIDLVLTDVYMPGNYNLELVRALNDSNVPVLLVTAYPDLNRAIEAANLTAAGQLPKPVTFSDLLEKVALSLSEIGAE
jgi:DNA-binding NtrC family response regulator